MTSTIKEAEARSILNKIPIGFEVKTSQFLQDKKIRGNGLYSTQIWQKGAILGQYRGRQMTQQQANKKRSHTNYMFDVTKNGKVVYVIDAASKRHSSFLRYVNAADDDTQQNTKFIQRNQKIYLQTLRKIKANEELLAWYGQSTANIIT